MVNVLALLVLIAQLGGFTGSSERAVREMLDLAGVKSGDYVVDLGSGDGRIVIEAAKRGATALGIEVRRDLVELSREKIRNAGLEGVAVIEQGDMRNFKGSPSVVTVFLGPADLSAIAPMFKQFNARVVSNGAPIPGYKAVKVKDIGQQMCHAERIGRPDACEPAPLYLYRIGRVK